MVFYDTSEWYIASDSSTKGTRNKKVLIEPETNITYFLKFPLIRPNRDYTPENWSEVIAYEVGAMLGFNVLRYDIAEYNGKVGCISKSMTEHDKEDLIEGHSILTRHDSTYNPEEKSDYARYTFDFVLRSLKFFDAEFFIDDFVKMLVFDAIIGNSDRHQSNWGIIRYQEEIGWHTFDTKMKAAPIYDSGCCLGREFGEEQIKQFLSEQGKFDKYIRKGTSELRVSETEKKPTHESLLTHIKTTYKEYGTLIDNEIKRVLALYDKDKLLNLIFGIDDALPERYREQYGLTDVRKEFVVRVLDRRINNLKNL